MSKVVTAATAAHEYREVLASEVVATEEKTMQRTALTTMDAPTIKLLTCTSFLVEIAYCTNTAGAGITRTNDSKYTCKAQPVK